MNWYDDIKTFGELVEENIEDQINVDQLILKLNISKFHFYRLFKAVIGISIHEYIRRRKIFYASRTLLESCQVILSIAVQYGFSSQEVFGRNFKKYFGMTPKEWRMKEDCRIESIVPLERFDIESISLDIKSYNGKVNIDERIESYDKSRFIGYQTISDDCKYLKIGLKKDPNVVSLL